MSQVKSNARRLSDESIFRALPKRPTEAETAGQKSRSELERERERGSKRRKFKRLQKSSHARVLVRDDDDAATNGGKERKKANNVN